MLCVRELQLKYKRIEFSHIVSLAHSPELDEYLELKYSPKTVYTNE